MADSIIVEDEETRLHKPVYFLGKDIREIKCFRDTFFYGICGGVAGGLISFMATSKARRSTHIALVSMWCCILGYWFPCRYKYESSASKVLYWKDQVRLERESNAESQKAS